MAAAWVCLLLVALGDAATIGGKSEASYDTVVVGLGASGIAAATGLARAGRKVLGLEAQDRLGGRVNTVNCGDGVVELGAEWIHGIEGSVTYQLALANNVSILQQQFSQESVWSDGRSADSALLEQLMTLTLAASADIPPQPQPLGHYITNKIKSFIAEHHPHLLNDTEFVDEFLSFADLVVDGYDGSDSWNDSTTHSTYQQLGGSQEMSWHRHGYRTLFEILLNKYHNGPGLPKLRIKLNTEVNHIEWPQNPNDKVVVTTKQGDRYTADNIIVTVSVGVLKERHSSLFTPQLPPAKVKAIETITLGVVDKIVLIFSKRWWPEDASVGFLWRLADKLAVPKEDEWITKIAGVSSPMGCDGALTLWTHGVAARYSETLPEEVVKTKSMELLRKFLGSNYTITEPIGMHRTTWFSNPYTRGSYSFDNLLAPEHPTLRQDLTEPLKDSSGKPRVLFAGEASNPIHYSTVHGAVETGQREAARLLGEEFTPTSHTTGLKSTSGRNRLRGSFKRTSA